MVTKKPTTNEITEVQKTHYYPFCGTIADISTGKSIQNKLYNGKEQDSSNNLWWYDYGARQYDPTRGQFTNYDQHCESYYNTNPLTYCGNNPVRRIDPTGMDWYKTENEEGAADYHWTNYSSQEEMDSNNMDGTYMGEAVVVFNGSRNEKLGKGNNLFGEGAVLATATVYGPKDENDIVQYGAFTVSSNLQKYGAIADGEYTVNYDKTGKSGNLTSHWAVNNRGPVDCIDGVNPNPGGHSSTQKDGIFIHCSNQSGSMLPKDKNGVVHPVSTGCLIIVPSRNGNQGWNEFNAQLSGVSKFKMVLKRD